MSGRFTGRGVIIVTLVLPSVCFTVGLQAFDFVFHVGEIIRRGDILNSHSPLSKTEIPFYAF